MLGCWGNLTMPWFDYSVYLDIIGVWRSLVAYLLWEQGGSGSNPDTPIFFLENFLRMEIWKTLRMENNYEK